METALQQLNLKNLDKSDWKVYRFDQIAKSISERVDPTKTDLEVYYGLEHLDSEDIHIKRHGSSSDVKGTKLRCYEGDIIFGRRRAYQRKAAVVEKEGFCSAHALVLRANPQVIEPKLFPFFLHSDVFMHRAIDISVGSLSPTINWGTLKSQEFLLPPKEQQAELAELLWAMDEVIEREREVNGALKQILAAEGRNSLGFGYSARSRELPENWKILRVKQFAKVQAGNTPLRSKGEYYKGGTTPWLKTLDLNNATISSTEEKITSQALDETSCKPRPKGTVLVAMYGGFNQIGRTGLLEIEAATNQAVAAIMVDEEVVLPHYLLQVLNSNIGYWKKVAISSRKDPNITKNDVENFPVPVPPIDVQKALVHRIYKIIESISRAESGLRTSRTLQKSLINQIF